MSRLRGVARRPDVLILVAAVAAATWFMTRSLAAKSLWIDEALSVGYAHQSFSELFPFFVHGELNMALYHVLLHFWLGFGDSETAVRSLSVVFALASIPFAYAICVRLFSRAAGSVAAVAWALNGVLYSFALDARAYSLVILLLVAGSYFLIRALDEPRPRWWTGYVLAMALAAYAHFFALFVIAAHFVSVFFGRRSRAQRAGIAVSSAVILALAVPAFVYIANGDTKLTSDQATSLWDVPDLFQWYAVGNRPLLVVYALGALAAAAVAIRRFTRRQKRDAWPVVFLVTWLATPIGGALIVSYTIDPTFAPRYLLVSLPALLFLVAGGIVVFRPLILVITLALTLTAASLRSLHLCEPGCATPTQDFRAATTFILARASTEDQVLFDPPYLQVAYDYYVNADTRRVTADAMPNDRVRDAARVWLLSDLGDPNRRQFTPLVREIQHRYKPVATQQFPQQLEVVLYTR